MSAYEIQFPWLARFKDGSELPQFNTDGSENLFRRVLDRQNDLVTFRVGPVTVDLRDGSFLVHGTRLYGSSEVEKFEEWGIDERLPKRIIYFRRVTRKFGAANLKEEGLPYIVYGVGWQATIPESKVNVFSPEDSSEVLFPQFRDHVVKGRNVKHVIYLHPNGDIIFQ